MSAAQEHLSPIFASMTGAGQEDRFAEATWTTLETGAPVLQDAVVSFDCRITQSTEVGTHTVFFCQVVALQAGGEPHGLIYFGRAYHRLIVAAA